MEHFIVFTFRSTVIKPLPIFQVTIRVRIKVTMPFTAKRLEITYVPSFLSCNNTLMHDINVAILSVHLSVTSSIDFSKIGPLVNIHTLQEDTI